MKAQLSLPQAKLLDELQVETWIELSAVTLSARELLDLTPGQTIPVRYDPAGLVSLRLGDGEIAKGRLTRSDDGTLLLELIDVELKCPRSP